MSCTSWVFSADLSEWYTDGYPIASGREQEEGLVDLLRVRFCSSGWCPAPLRKLLPVLFRYIAEPPRIGLRLGTLHKSCRSHCPQRSRSVPGFPVVGPICNDHQVPGTFPPTAAPRHELHHRPCLAAVLLHALLPPLFCTFCYQALESRGGSTATATAGQVTLLPSVLRLRSHPHHHHLWIW